MYSGIPWGEIDSEAAHKGEYEEEASPTIVVAEEGKAMSWGDTSIGVIRFFCDVV